MLEKYAAARVVCMQLPAYWEACTCRTTAMYEQTIEYAVVGQAAAAHYGHAY